MRNLPQNARKPGRTPLRNPTKRHTIWAEHQHSKEPGKGWPVHWRVLEYGEKPKRTQSTMTVMIGGKPKTVVMERRALTPWAEEQLMQGEGMTHHITAPASRLFESEGYGFRGQGKATHTRIELGAGGKPVKVEKRRKPGR